MRQGKHQVKKISPNITYYEATKSYTAQRHGIDNTPNEMQLKSMQQIAEKIFEPTRKHLGGVPLPIGSFFRSYELNKRIGGAKGSQHCLGQAMDIDVDGSIHIYNYQVFNFIYENLDFDQLIWEFGDEFNPDWVHVSYVREDLNRKQALVAYLDINGIVKYKKFRI